ncbi:hypothetical protein ACFLWB_02195 [Chloroflexota bacterium]
MEQSTAVRGPVEIRIATTPSVLSELPQEGINDLNAHSLGMEKQLLEAVKSHLKELEERIKKRLAEIYRAMKKLDGAAGVEKAAGVSSWVHCAVQHTPLEQHRGKGQWKKIAFE